MTECHKLGEAAEVLLDPNPSLNFAGEGRSRYSSQSFGTRQKRGRGARILVKLTMAYRVIKAKIEGR